jgi:hypothetical protein
MDYIAPGPRFPHVFWNSPKSAKNLSSFIVTPTMRDQALEKVREMISIVDKRLGDSASSVDPWCVTPVPSPASILQGHHLQPAPTTPPPTTPPPTPTPAPHHLQLQLQHPECQHRKGLALKKPMRLEGSVEKDFDGCVECFHGSLVYHPTCHCQHVEF